MHKSILNTRGYALSMKSMVFSALIAPRMMNRPSGTVSITYNGKWFLFIRVHFSIKYYQEFHQHYQDTVCIRTLNKGSWDWMPMKDIDG